MSNEELRKKLDELSTKIDKCEKNTNSSNGHGLLKAIFVSIAGLILLAVFGGGQMYQDVQYLKKNNVSKEKIEQIDKTAYDAYNKAYFNKDTRFNTRGGLIHKDKEDE